METSDFPTLAFTGQKQVMAHKVPNSPETQFKPGESGNPSGRPKGALSFKTIINKWLSVEMDEVDPATGETIKMPLMDILTIKQIQKAKKGDTRAYEILKDHIEAKPKQGIDLTSAGESLAGKEIVFKRYSGSKDKGNAK